MINQLGVVVAANVGTPVADKVADAAAKAQTALMELDKTPPDNQAALGNIEGAVGELEAAINEGLDAAQANALMDQLAAIARQIVRTALDQAIALPSPDSSVIAEAEMFLVDGDALRDVDAFKDAINKYKDALSKAQSLLP